MKICMFIAVKFTRFCQYFCPEFFCHMEFVGILFLSERKFRFSLSDLMNLIPNLQYLSSSQNPKFNHFTTESLNLITNPYLGFSIRSQSTKPLNLISENLQEIIEKFRMSATIVSERMMISTQEPSSTSSSTSTTVAVAVTVAAATDIEFAKCECCGLTEECTPQYIDRIRERYMGKWVCGLCAEAVKDEVIRSRRIITTEEALNRHLNVCRKFRSSCPATATGDLIKAFRHILRRSLDSPRSTLACPTRDSAMKRRPVLARSESCFPGLSG